MASQGSSPRWPPNQVMIGESTARSNRSAVAWCAKSTPSTATRIVQQASTAPAQGRTEAARRGGLGRDCLPSALLRSGSGAPERSAAAWPSGTPGGLPIAVCPASLPDGFIDAFTAAAFACRVSSARGDAPDVLRAAQPYDKADHNGGDDQDRGEHRSADPYRGDGVNQFYEGPCCPGRCSRGADPGRCRDTTPIAGITTPMRIPGTAVASARTARSLRIIVFPPPCYR